MRLLAGTILAVTLTACGGGGSHDQTFLRIVSHNGQLASEDHKTLISLGHEACDLLGDFHGDTAQVDSFFVKTGGEGGAAFFTPSVMDNLRGAATTAYCPKYA